MTDSPSTPKPSVVITYCTQCNWLLRAGWMAQELLQTFGVELGAVTLVPGTGGIYTIDVDGERIWDRKRDGGFPDVKTLKPTSRSKPTEHLPAFNRRFACQVVVAIRDRSTGSKDRAIVLSRGDGALDSPRGGWETGSSLLDA